MVDDPARKIERGLAAIPPDQVRSVRYEALVADPIAHLRGIAEWTGAGASPTWLAELSRLSFPEGTELWRAGLAPETIALFERIQRDTLRRYGYM